VGHLQQGSCFDANEIVKSDPVTQRSQVTQFLDQFVVGCNGFQNFQNNAIRRKALTVVTGDQIFVKIDEGQLPANDFLQADVHERVDNDVGRRVVAIGE
jgi:hypothetical protein